MSEEGRWTAASKLYRRLAAYVISLLAGLVTLVVGRREDRWIFGSFVGQPQFSNNAKYLYLHLAHDHPEIRPIWMTDSAKVHDTLEKAGHEVVRRWSWKARYHALRARFVVLDSGLGAVPFAYTNGAVRVQLSHGIPLKGPRRWEQDDDIGEEEGLERFLDRLGEAVDGVEHFCVPSEQGARQFARWVKASAYRGYFERSFPSSTLLVTGFPRTDIFHRQIPDADLGNPPELEETLEDLDEHEAVIGYFPTFRDGPGSIDPFDPEELGTFLEERDAVLLVKPHHEMDIVLPSQSDHIRSIPPSSDSSTFLQNVDILVTDYSSLYFDYLHTGNPIVLYTFDRKEYEQARGLLSNFDQITSAGIHVDTFSELRDTLGGLMDEDLVNPLAAEAERFCEDFFLHRDGGAAERIVAALTEEGNQVPTIAAEEVIRRLECEGTGGA